MILFRLSYAVHFYPSDKLVTTVLIIAIHKNINFYIVHVSKEDQYVKLCVAIYRTACTAKTLIIIMSAMHSL